MIRNRSTRRVARAVGAATGAAAMLAALVAPSALAATPPPAQTTDAFCVNADDSGFTDLTSNQDNINCMAFTGITQGLSGGTTYGPGNPVTRAQMASFIARMIDEANELDLTGNLPDLPATGPDAFTDDNSNATHEPSINRLAAANVVAGIGGGLFAPDQPVSRAQMATFINNAQGFLGAGQRFTSTEDFFTDDDLQTAHEANINGLAAASIVQGGPGGIAQTLYGPELPVNRSQMASFVIRYMAVLHEAGIIDIAGGTPEPTTNQTFTVTPADESVNEVSTGAADNTGRHTYEVSGLTDGEEYEIALVQADTVTDADGQISFSAFTLAAEATIELVDGESTGQNAGTASEDKQVTAEAEGTTLTFVVDSDAPDSVIPVIWADSDAAPTGTLGLADDGKPDEPFGVGGQKNWVPAEATDADTGGVVTIVNYNFDYVVIGGDTYYYDSNDTFRYNGGTDLSVAAFEGMLTVGDDIDITYEPEAEDTSIFDVTVDWVQPASQVTAVIASEATDDNTVTVSWAPSAQGDVTYTVSRDDGQGGAFVELEDEITGTSFTDTGVEDLAPADPGYIYRVTATGGTSGTDSADADSATGLVVPSPDEDLNVLPNGALVDNDEGATGNATEDDVWVIFTDNDIVLDNASIEVDGQVIEDGVDADFVAEDNKLTITLTDDNAAVTYPATIDSVSGIESVDGVALDFAADNTLEANGPELLAESFTDGDGEDTVTLIFNEKLLVGPAQTEANYTFVDADAGGVVVDTAVLDATGYIVTVTFSGDLEVGDTLIVGALVVDDDNQPYVPAMLTVV